MADAHEKLDDIANQIGNELGEQNEVNNEPTETQKTEETQGEAQASAGNEENQISEAEQKARDLGWISLDEWTEAGKDPANWSGHQAFMRFKDMANSDKTLRSELQETKAGITQMLEQFESMNKRQQEKHKEELSKAMEKAKRDLDFDAYEQAADQLSEIEQSQAKKQPQSPEAEHPVIAAFRTNNPKIDKQSSEFNEAFNMVMEQNANNLIMARSNGLKLQLSDTAMQQCLDDALEKTKAMMPEPQKRSQRKPPPANTPNRGQKTDDPVSQLDEIATSTYNFIKKAQGSRAAKRFAENYSKGA